MTADELYPIKMFEEQIASLTGDSIDEDIHFIVSNVETKKEALEKVRSFLIALCNRSYCGKTYKNIKLEEVI